MPFFLAYYEQRQCKQNKTCIGYNGYHLVVISLPDMGFVVLQQATTKPDEEEGTTKQN